MWPLFLSIGVGFLLLLCFGWGLSTGVKLGKKAQGREHEAFRVAGQQALAAHGEERKAWRVGIEAPHSTEQTDAAELAHVRTRDAILALSPAWGDFGPSESETKAH